VSTNKTKFTETYLCGRPGKTHRWRVTNSAGGRAAWGDVVIEVGSQAWRWVEGTRIAAGKSITVTTPSSFKLRVYFEGNGAKPPAGVVKHPGLALSTQVSSTNARAC
jgi:hypothetical protein